MKVSNIFFELQFVNKEITLVQIRSDLISVYQIFLLQNPSRDDGKSTDILPSQKTHTENLIIIPGYSTDPLKLIKYHLVKMN